MSAKSALRARPDEQKIVIEAVEVAACRGLPLAADLVEKTSKVQAYTAAPRNVGDKTLPRPAPWTHLSPETLEKMGRVDIMASLSPLAARMTVVEEEIARLITTPIKLIGDAASHTLNAGGKRLRPALTLLCAQLCGDEGDTPNPRVVTSAAAIELTHTTTLLHDDVVDEADTRRGQPTARLLWGNETSVLVGDYMFAQVFVTVTQKGFGELVQPLAVATAQMCAGELLETQTRGYLELSEKQYREIISLKTASLTDCACRLGALSVDADDETVERVARFGHDIGMAFQIVDDVFDITSSEGHLGKPVGHDIREGDITLPLLRAMQVCSEAEKAELRRIVQLSITPGKEVSEADTEIALKILRGCDAVEYSLGIAREYIETAQEQLAFFPESPARTMLGDIASYVTSREK